MIYGKVWLVVKPTVGIPLFFIGVVTLAMLVHFAILTHTTWFPAYWQGNAKKVSAVMPDSGPPVVKLIG